MTADTLENKMLGVVAAFLKTKGWNVVVIGGCQVRHDPADLKFNYEFTVRFTGTPPEDAKPGGSGAK